MKTLILTSTLLIAGLFLSNCSDELTGIETNTVEKSVFIDTTYCTDSIFTTTIDDLSETDIEGLMLMREEEKLAHDVYVYFFEKYDVAIFDRISVSETKHADAVLRLLNHFGLTDPSSTEAGIFANEELQTLYNLLIEKGDVAVEDALAVGALIEETDIQDLQSLLEATENADLTTVYTHLLRGSYQHLKGFSKMLLTYDVMYVPQVLSQEVYDAILATPNGNGNQGKGTKGGNGKKSGKGNKGGNGNRGGNGGGQGNNGNSGNNGQGSGDGTGTCVNG